MNNRLQQFLTLENLSPARLADMLGIQRSGLSHILSGRNKPGYDFILKLCTKFPHLNANWFITGQGKPYKDSNVKADHQSLHSIAISTPASVPTPIPTPVSVPASTPISTPSSVSIPASTPTPVSAATSTSASTLASTPTPFQNFGTAKNENYRNDNIYNNSQQINYINSDILKDNIYSDSVLEAKSQNTSSTPPNSLFQFSDDSGQIEINEQYDPNNQIINTQKSTSYPRENQINAEQKAFVQKKKSVKRVIIFYNDGSFDELFPSGKPL